MSINDPNAVVTRNPANQAQVRATADPLLLTLQVNISPMRTFGTIPNPVTEIKCYTV